MKLIALLCWYDEPVAWLTELVEGLGRAGVDTLVALDGAYALYPNGRTMSPFEQFEALEQGCDAHGIQFESWANPTLWQGNELEKRSAAFEHAHELSGPGDWLWVVDADEIVTEVLPNLRQTLEAAEEDVAECLLWWRDGDDPKPSRLLEALAPESVGEYTWVRKFFRWQETGIHLPGPNHWHYFAGDGRMLWGDPPSKRVDCLRLWREVLIEHRLNAREPERLAAQFGYYRNRREQAAETHMGVPH